MTKICFVTTIGSTLEAFVLKFAKYLHNNTDWDISFICSSDEKFEKSLPDYIHFLPVQMKRGIDFSGIKAIGEFKKIFKREKFDIVQYSTPNAALYASVAAKVTRIPVRLYCQWGLIFQSFQGVKRRIFLLEEKFVCENSTWIEPDSHGNLNLCRELKLYGSNSSVVHYGSACGIDLQKFDIAKKRTYSDDIRNKLSIPQDAFVFGFVGSVTGDKGINELMAASKEILAQNDNCFLVVVGPLEKEDSINQNLYQWALNEKRFIFVGQSNAVEQYMAAFDCYVMPSYREGFGMTVIEAGAMGLPVISSNIPGPTDAIIDELNGLVVEKKNAEQLRDAMIRMLSNRELVEQYGQNGHQNVISKYEQNTLFKFILEDRKRLLSHNQE